MGKVIDMGRSVRFFAVLLCVVFFAVSCDSLTLSPDLTIVNLKITATDDLNPDASGRPSPLQVQIFELKQTGLFDSADFRALLDSPEAVLKSDLVSVDRVVLQPGKSTERKWQVAAEAQFVGIAASYRNLNTAVWRTVIAVAPEETTTSVIFADSDGLVVGE